MKSFLIRPLLKDAERNGQTTQYNSRHRRDGENPSLNNMRQSEMSTFLSLLIPPCYLVSRTDINVLQADGRVEKIESGLESETGSIWLTYYRHSFGLGEHYNALKKIS